MAVPRLCYRLIVGVNGGRAATPGVPQLIFMGIAPKKSRLSMTAPGYSIGRCCGPSLPSDLEFACLDQWRGPRAGPPLPGAPGTTRGFIGSRPSRCIFLRASLRARRIQSKADGRSVSLRLTNKGNKALARDPFEVLVRAVDSLDVKERATMHHALHQALTTVAASGAHRRFGVCQDCTYFGGERCCNPTIASPSTSERQPFGVPIQPADAGLLCVHFQPTSEHNDGAHELTSAICGKDA